MNKPLLLAAAIVYGLSLQASAATFALSPNGKYLYVVGEMSGTVTAFSINDATGALTRIAVANGIPERLKLAHGEVRDARNANQKFPLRSVGGKQGREVIQGGKKAG